jgi:hypothetical protein
MLVARARSSFLVAGCRWQVASSKEGNRIGDLGFGDWDWGIRCHCERLKALKQSVEPAKSGCFISCAMTLM